MSRPVDVAALIDQWSEALRSWAIPPEILERAERDPWVHPVDRFAQRADRATTDPSGASFERAAEVICDRPGSVLDVGAGAGAASLPLAAWATCITAVDPSREMLAAFGERAARLGVEHRAVEDTWPEAADQVGVHDVAVVHHVVYNVPDIAPFVSALDAKSSRRVVLELPTHHPLSWMNPLWEQFHGITRPTGPTAGDLVEIVSALGFCDVSAEYWSVNRESGADVPGSTEGSTGGAAEGVTRRLCLPASRTAEVAEAMAGVDHGHRDLVTVSWTPGSS